MFYTYTDYTTQGANPLQVIRYYNSRTTNSSPTLGANWTTNYDRTLAILSSTSVYAARGNGRTLQFTLSGSNWVTDSDVDYTLTHPSPGNWVLVGPDDTVETYTISPANSATALLSTVTLRGGYQQTITYTRLYKPSTVTDTYGRTLTFNYYSSSLLESITTPDNTTISYTIGNPNGIFQLTGVTFPTSPTTTITYEYNDPDNFTNLTGVVDENGATNLSWTYDSSSRALTSIVGTGAYAETTTVSYNDTDGSRVVTNALGVQDTYSFTTLQKVPKVTSISRAATPTTAAASRIFTYDDNGYLASQTDWNGNETTYTNNPHGLPTKIVEAVGSSPNVSRTTSITYDAPTWVHLPKSIATADLTESFTYNAQGLPKSRKDVSPGLVREWSFDWSDALLSSVTGPRTDVAQITRFNYNATGALERIMNALGQTIRIPSSTGGGLPLTIIDPNGVATTLTYTPRQWPQFQTIHASGGNFITRLSYDAAGNLTETRLPDGSYLASAYDTAHRLIMTRNAIGDTIAYTLDGLGDRTQDAVGRSGTTTWQHADAFDALGRIITDEGGAGQKTTIMRDPNGNPTAIIDPLSRMTARAFDALNRVTTIVDPAKGVTHISYDAHDRITRVIAPNGAATTYDYDGFGRLRRRVSPDTGTTTYAYDLADNLLQSVDASGVVTYHAYDALNRIISTSYPADPSENVALVYDQLGHGYGVGHLTSVADAAGSLSLAYDLRGNELGETRTSGSLSLATSYAYDAASRIAAIGYPSGNVASYIRNKAGEVTSVTAQLNGASSATSIVSGVTYLPFGPPGAWVWGNGLQDSRTYDAAYRLGNLADGSVQYLTYSYDAADNVIGIADGVNSGNSQSFGHDLLDHLTAATGAYGAFGWRYDGVGNRLTQTFTGGPSSRYSYVSRSNVLSSITTNGQTTQVSTSQAGNILAVTPISGAALNLGFNQAERLATAAVGGTSVASYVYDAFGNRFSKTLATGGSLFLRDQAKNLLEETALTGSLNIDTVYLNGVPVADITPSAIFFLHADRLGTPQVATTTTQAIAWQAAYQPFGTNAGGSGLFTQNLRFPGQYSDIETGLYQNGLRDYNPALGRYLESDQYGLSSGYNTYAYGFQNPQKYRDDLGLFSTGPIFGGTAGANAPLIGGGAATISWQEGVYSSDSGTSFGSITTTGGSAGQNPIPFAAASIGAGWYISNANDPSQQAGDSNTSIFGVYFAEFQYSVTGDTWQWSLTLGWGGTIGYYKLQTSSAVLKPSPGQPCASDDLPIDQEIKVGPGLYFFPDPGEY